ncbi:MAG: lipoyl synthase [Deltaproteobacteria bacterium]|nr:lipoyl synthase [Deltaproteobacteria bacterium]
MGGRGIAARMPGRLSERHAVKTCLRRAGLHTVCEEARCPNICECFGRGTATFLILGDVCTRGCAFCAVDHHRVPSRLDPAEPARLADAICELGLRHVVITSVTRDDLPDGGAGMFVECVRQIRARCPGVTIELLVPDFAGSVDALVRVLDEGPEVLNHNTETVARLYPRVRPGADLDRSLDLLRRARERGGCVVKSGFMLGLGETDGEVEGLLGKIAQTGCQVVTAGQYLRPMKRCLEVARRLDAEQFARIERRGEELGMLTAAGELVRSSFRAQDLYERARERWGPEG